MLHSVALGSVDYSQLNAIQFLHSFYRSLHTLTKSTQSCKVSATQGNIHFVVAKRHASSMRPEM